MLRATLWGIAVGGGAFFLLGIALNVATGMGTFTNLGPVAILMVIGATIGGLVAPMFRQGLRRRGERKERRRGGREDRGQPADGDGVDGGKGKRADGTSGERP